MRCPHCGKNIQDASKTCQFCGEKIKAGSTSGDEQMGKSNSGASAKPPLKWPLILFLGVISIGALYYFFSDHSPSIPPADFSHTSDIGDPFYATFRESIQETGVAKKYFKEAQSMASAVTSPASMPSETAPSPQLLKAAENYAKAMERFKYAQQLMDNLKLKTDDDREPCRQSFRQILDRYHEASDIFSQNAKAASQGQADSKTQSAAVDAKAKYEMADQLMVKFLMDGCNGAVFKSVSEKSAAEKNAMFMAYQRVLLENFEPQKAALEKLFQAKAPPDIAPAESNPAK